MTLKLKFSARPDNDWQHAFQGLSGVGRSGSTDYVMAGPPRIEGQVLLWTVPAADMEDAFRFVERSTGHANGRYQELLKQRADEAAERARQQGDARAAAQAKHDELKRKLDSF